MIPSEEEINAWDLEATVAYGRNALRNHADDPSELLLRRDVLMTSPHGASSPVLREVVMLSVSAHDLDTAKLAIGWLEQAGDPAMGYFVYKALLDQSRNEEAETFLQSSARHGFLPAERVLLDREASKSLFPWISRAVARFKHARKVAGIAKANPKDLRLG